MADEDVEKQLVVAEEGKHRKSKHKKKSKKKDREKEAHTNPAFEDKENVDPSNDDKPVRLDYTTLNIENEENKEQETGGKDPLQKKNNVWKIQMPSILSKNKDPPDPDQLYPDTDGDVTDIEAAQPKVVDKISELPKIVIEGIKQESEEPIIPHEAIISHDKPDDIFHEDDLTRKLSEINKDDLTDSSVLTPGTDNIHDAIQGAGGGGNMHVQAILVQEIHGNLREILKEADEDHPFVREVKSRTPCHCTWWLKCSSKVLPTEDLDADHIRNEFNIDLSSETAPPEGYIQCRTKGEDDPLLIDMYTGDVIDYMMGRKLYFEDGKKRIDIVLAWQTKQKDAEKEDQFQRARECFEKNLRIEGLELEPDIQEGREVQYMKIHAPYDVLCRYAEIMKMRMPMKEIPEEIKSSNMWELMADYVAKLLSPFELDPAKVPPMPKKFTSVYSRDKEYLFAVPENKDLFFSHASRSMIVDYILRRKKYSDDNEETFAFGITRLLKNGVYTSSFPVHEGSWKPWTKPSMRRLLYEHWAYWKNFYKAQPLDHIRTYFGEKIGFYFAWLGFYTYMLIPASVVGLIVFIYGVATMNDNIVAKEACNWSNNFTMCPQCDKRCPYWNYAASCYHVTASHMFDNNATVFFSVFMSLWGTIFLEFWKREQASIQFKWNLLNFEAEEEPPRPEYLISLVNSKHRKKHHVTGIEEPYIPFWRRKVPVFLATFSVMMFLVLIAVAVVIGVIVYRMAVSSVLHLRDEEIFYKNASMVTTATAACINLLAIFILNFIYQYLAVVLTDWECLRTQTEYDNSLTFKLYILQFVNYYSSIIYIAFFKGRFLGHPGNYNKLFNARQEECSAGGCLIELCIQLAIIFVGKWLIQNNLLEIFLPRIKRKIMECFETKMTAEEKAKLKPWEKDYKLEEAGQRALFNEYLEMLLQFGFVTIFVAAFPLAPLFALINNIIEVRADANKFITQLRRPMAVRAQDIGVWYEVLHILSRMAILSNAFIIAITSGFIHRMVYKYGYSEDRSLNGYLNHTLSYFNTSDLEFPPDSSFDQYELCRYQDYRQDPWNEDKYTFTAEFWHVLAAQFLFIVIFENVVVVATCLVSYAIPDMPRKLMEQVRREAYLTNEIKLKVELEKAQGGDGVISSEEMYSIRKRAQNKMSGGAGVDESNL